MFTLSHFRFESVVVALLCSVLMSYAQSSERFMKHQRDFDGNSKLDGISAEDRLTGTATMIEINIMKRQIAKVQHEMEINR